MIVEDDYNSTASSSTSQEITQMSRLKQNTSHSSPSYASLGNGSHFKAQDNTFSNSSLLKQSFENNGLSFTDPEFSPFHFDSTTDYPLLSSLYASSPGHYFDVIRSKSDNSNLLVRNRSNNVFKFPDLVQNSQQSCNSSNSSSSFNALRHYSDPQKLRSSPSSSHSSKQMLLEYFWFNLGSYFSLLFFFRRIFESFTLYWPTKFKRRFTWNKIIKFNKENRFHRFLEASNGKIYESKSIMVWLVILGLNCTQRTTVNWCIWKTIFYSNLRKNSQQNPNKL